MVTNGGGGGGDGDGANAGEATDGEGESELECKNIDDSLCPLPESVDELCVGIVLIACPAACNVCDPSPAGTTPAGVVGNDVGGNVDVDPGEVPSGESDATDSDGGGDRGDVGRGSDGRGTADPTDTAVSDGGASSGDGSGVDQVAPSVIADHDDSNVAAGLSVNAIVGIAVAGGIVFLLALTCCVCRCGYCDDGDKL